PEEVGHLSRDGLESVVAAADPGDRAEEALRVGVQRAIKDIQHRRVLHDPARIHDRHLVRLLGHHAEVVRDQGQRHSVLLARRETGRWSRTASAIWLPTVNTGLSDVIGSWKIMARPAPRTARMSRSGSVRRSRPSKKASPPTMRPGGGTRRMSERAVTLFPQ